MDDEERSKPPLTRRLRSSSAALVTYVVAQAVLLFWWVAYHPGLFSPDSLGYIWQSTTGNWNTHHPISYTALVWSSLQLTGGVGALTLTQTVATAAGLAYAVAGLRRLGGPGWLWGTAAVAVVALPPVGTFVICVWKDVAFVLCHLFLLGTLARLVGWRRTAASGTPPRPLLGALLAETTLICLFRQNGFVSMAITVVLCALLLRGTFARLLAIGAAAVSAALLTNWLLLPALGVRQSESIVAFESFFSDISVAYAADPGVFSPHDTAVMAKVAPLSHWRDSANCRTVDTTVYHPRFDRAAAAHHRNELLAVWWHVARRRPGIFAEARICRGSIAWRPTSTGGLSRNPTPWGMRVHVARNPTFQQSPFRNAVRSAPLSHRAHTLARKLNAATQQPEWLLWRGATWAYVTYLVIGLVAWRRREPALLMLAALTVGLQISVLVFNAVQAARYMAAPFVLGVLSLPLLAAARRPGDAAPPTTPATIPPPDQESSPTRCAAIG